MTEKCTVYCKDYHYSHIFEIIGNPYSKMTYYRCEKCGQTIERGKGIMFKEEEI